MDWTVFEHSSKVDLDVHSEVQNLFDAFRDVEAAELDSHKTIIMIHCQRILQKIVRLNVLPFGISVQSGKTRGTA